MIKYSRDIRKYIRDIERWLPCTGSVRRKLLSDIRLSVNNYLLEYPTASTSQITAALGTPQQIVTSYVDQIDTNLLMHNLRTKKRILYVISAICSVLLLTWSIIVMYEFIEYLGGISDKYYYTIT